MMKKTLLVVLVSMLQGCAFSFDPLREFRESVSVKTNPPVYGPYVAISAQVTVPNLEVKLLGGGARQYGRAVGNVTPGDAVAVPFGMFSDLPMTIMVVGRDNDGRLIGSATQTFYPGSGAQRWEVGRYDLR